MSITPNDSVTKQLGPISEPERTTYNATLLRALADRACEGTGPDRELDVQAVIACFPEIGECVVWCKGDPPIFMNAPYLKQECPKITSSIDAVEALRERVLPGTWIRVVATSNGMLAEINKALSIGSATAATEPRARLAAFLRALASTQEG